MDEIENKIEDTYWEHSQHDIFDENCSKCFKEKLQIDTDDMMVGVEYEIEEGDSLGYNPED